MRILYLITRAEHGGAQAHLLCLVEEAVKRGQVWVGIGEDGRLREQLDSMGVETTVLRHLRHRPHAWHDLAGVAEIWDLIRQFKPDLVHAHSGKAGLLGRCAAACRHIPSVYTSHGFSFTPNAKSGRRVIALAGEWLAGRLGDFTIAVSQSECQLGRDSRVTRAGKRAFIYNGVRESTLRASPECEPPVITMVARFAYPKQQAVLIRAFSRMQAEARLWLIGSGPALPEAREEARRCSKSERIVFWGDRNDVRELLARSQIAALISAHEGFGLSLIEAMSVGLPVIATDRGGMREIIRPGKNGWLVPLYDEAALTNALEDLVGNSQRRREMGECGLEDFRGRFTAKVMVEKTFAVYDALLSRSVKSHFEKACKGSCLDCEHSLTLAGD